MKGREKNYRKDIQGLRALGLVVMFMCHAELSAGSGGFVGLDVFFVISGFLITGLIVAEMERTGSLSLTRFYARRVRRLLPLAITVLATVVLVSWLVYTPVQADRVSGDVIAASVYVVNWHFAAQEVDYFAVDPADSPLQHFWSLSVEEQFYLLWPALLLAGFAWWSRRPRRRLSVRAGLAVVVAAMGLPAFVYSAFLMDLTTHGAYFSTLGRVWEFALGGALALVLPATLRLPRAVVHVLGWAGIATILATTVAFTSATPYPGTAVILPVAATAAVVVAGTASTTAAPIRLLSAGPMQYLGRISYAWYLWHWPALVFARAAWGSLTGLEALAVIAASWVPTAITHRWIEEPLRFAPALAARSRRALSFGAACMAVAVGMAALLTALQPTVPTASSSELTGALAAQRGEPIQRTARALRPPPRRAADDRGRIYEDGCLVEQEELESPPCVYGRRSSQTTVVLFGDSHAMHWFEALHSLARERGWRLVALTRAGCPVSDVHFAYRCDTWRERTLARIERRERPDLVVVGTSTSSPTGVVRDGERLTREESEPHLRAGFRRTLERLRATGAQVAVMKDLPRAPDDVPSCVSDAIDQLDSCAFPDRRERDRGEFDVHAARRVEGAFVVDAAPVLCPDGRCPAVIGNALVYRDDNHFTATFARTLAPWLGRQLPEL